MKSPWILWLLIFCIGWEDFRSERMVRFTHSHVYEQGGGHPLPGHPASSELEDRSGEPSRQDPWEHTHLVYGSIEVPALIAKSLRYPAAPSHQLLLLGNGPETMTGGVSGKDLFRPPRAA